MLSQANACPDSYCRRLGTALFCRRPLCLCHLHRGSNSNAYVMRHGGFSRSSDQHRHRVKRIRESLRVPPLKSMVFVALHARCDAIFRSSMESDPALSIPLGGSASASLTGSSACLLARRQAMTARAFCRAGPFGSPSADADSRAAAPRSAATAGYKHGNGSTIQASMAACCRLNARLLRNASATEAAGGYHANISSGNAVHLSSVF